MAKRILVPLDQSLEAESVVPLIVDAARGSGATVRLLHVAPISESPIDQTGQAIADADRERERLESEGMDYLRAVELQFGEAPVECVVRFGDPVRKILKEADTFGADLVAMTTTGSHTRGAVFCGSVAEEIFRSAKVPVILFRVGQPPRM